MAHEYPCLMRSDESNPAGLASAVDFKLIIWEVSIFLQANKRVARENSAKHLTEMIPFKSE